MPQINFKPDGDEHSRDFAAHQLAQHSDGRMFATYLNVFASDLKYHHTEAARDMVQTRLTAEAQQLIKNLARFC